MVENNKVFFANCHNHSTYSDGEYTPEELVDIAAEKGYRALLLTDHDTVKGQYSFQKAARKKGIMTLNACEFSSRTLNIPFHILGIDFDSENNRIREILERGQQKQTQRTALLLQFGKERGYVKEELTMELACRLYPDNDYFCCSHLLNAALRYGIYNEDEIKHIHKNVFSASRKTVREDEARIKEINGLYYFDGVEVVRAIVEAGGVAVAAHPGKYIGCVKPLIEAGLGGIEIRHPDCSGEQNKECEELCRELGLYRLGGTDHSSVLGSSLSDVPMSSGYITEEEFMELYERRLG